MKAQQRYTAIKREQGVSLVLCCHNGASRLPATLAHLAAQEPPASPWEVVLIDNRSTDGSAEVARLEWRNGPVPLRVIKEARLGTRYARERGILEANYEFIAFVDDDNWLAPDWVKIAHEIMSSEASLGALSGIRKPALETPQPEWFSHYHGPYAILTSEEFQATRESPPPYLPTAGLCIRSAAWRGLVELGFSAMVPGRVGEDLSGGEDTELTLALSLCGWKLRIEPRLRLDHFIPAHRLEWSYLRRLMRNIHASTVLLDSYTSHSLSLQPGVRCNASDWWCYQLGKILFRLPLRPRAAFAALISSGENQHEVIEIERLVGRSIGLLRTRARYGAARRGVRAQFAGRNIEMNPCVP